MEVKNRPIYITREILTNCGDKNGK